MIRASHGAGHRAEHALTRRHGAHPAPGAVRPVFPSRRCARTLRGVRGGRGGPLDHRRGARPAPPRSGRRSRGRCRLPWSPRHSASRTPTPPSSGPGTTRSLRRFPISRPGARHRTAAAAAFGTAQVSVRGDLAARTCLLASGCRGGGGRRRRADDGGGGVERGGADVRRHRHHRGDDHQRGRAPARASRPAETGARGPWPAAERDRGIGHGSSQPPP